MDRRTFLTSSTLAAATVTLARGQSSAAPPAGIIDTNVSLGEWAVRHASTASAETLVAKLRRHGVVSAWTGSFEGVLQTDIAGVNARLAEACARIGEGILQPFGTINLALPDWEEDLRRCAEVHRMRGIRLFPNYHGYGLEDARFARMMDAAARRGLVVQIMMAIEDDRSQNPALAVAPVAAGPLGDVMTRLPEARVMLLNSGARVLGGNPAYLQRMVAAKVGFEIAALEGVAGIESVLARAPGVRLMFGSHIPYFYFEAALLKLQESALSVEQLDAVRSANARTLLA